MLCPVMYFRKKKNPAFSQKCHLTRHHDVNSQTIISLSITSIFQNGTASITQRKIIFLSYLPGSVSKLSIFQETLVLLTS